jgi:hypothetical protein
MKSTLVVDVGNSQIKWRHTLRFLAAAYALAFVWGIRSLYYWEQSLLDLLVPVCFVIALGWWTVADAEARGHPIPLLAQPWFYLCGWLLTPAYVIWSRGWRGVGWIVLHCIGWQAAIIATWWTLNVAFGDFTYRPRH